VVLALSAAEGSEVEPPVVSEVEPCRAFRPFMFCPLCKAEYREGFYRCADCDVDLVHFLAEPPAEEAPGESLELLWRGQDPVLFTAVLSALNDAQIAHHDRTTQDNQGLSSPSFPAVYSAPGFEIRVFRSDLEDAQRILGDVLQALLAGADSTPAPEGALENQDMGVGGISNDWNLEEATAEVWSGNDRAMAQFVADTFRENGIASRTLAESGAAARILVRAQDQGRAREIIRQIAAGLPPA